MSYLLTNNSRIVSMCVRTFRRNFREPHIYVLRSLKVKEFKVALKGRRSEDIIIQKHLKASFSKSKIKDFGNASFKAHCWTHCNKS
jgi:hypothetical protein